MCVCGGGFGSRTVCTHVLVLGQTSHSPVLIGAFPLVGGVLGQSHVHLGLELITQVTVLRSAGRKTELASSHLMEETRLLAIRLKLLNVKVWLLEEPKSKTVQVPGTVLAGRGQAGSSATADSC